MQLAISLLIAGFLLVAGGATLAWMALFGGWTGMLANGCFVVLSLRVAKTASAGRILTGFYLGQAVKVAILILCLVAVFVYVPEAGEGLNVLALLGTLFATQMTYIVAPRFTR